MYPKGEKMKSPKLSSESWKMEFLNSNGKIFCQLSEKELALLYWPKLNIDPKMSSFTGTYLHIYSVKSILRFFFYSSFNLLVEKVLEEAIKYKNQNPTVNSTLTSKVIKIYLSVIRDCLHADVILSVDKLISASLIHYLSLYASHSELKTSEASFILESMVSLCSHIITNTNLFGSCVIRAHFAIQTCVKYA